MSASFNTASTTTVNNSVSSESVQDYTIPVPPPLNQRQDWNTLSQEDRNMLMRLAPATELERWFIGTAPIPIHISAPPTEELNDYTNMELVYPGQSPAPSSIYRPAPTPTPSALDRMDPPAQRVFSPRPIRLIDIQALQDIGNQVQTWLNQTYPNAPRALTPYPPMTLNRPEHTAYISPSTTPSNSIEPPSTPSTTPENRPPTPVEDPWANQPTDDENGWPEADTAEQHHTDQAKAAWAEAPNHPDRHGRRLFTHPYHREKILSETPYRKSLDRYLRVAESDPLFTKLQKDLFTQNPWAMGDVIKYRQIAIDRWRTRRELKKLEARLSELKYQETHCRRFLNRAGIPHRLRYYLPGDTNSFDTECDDMEKFLGPWDRDLDHNPYWS